MTLNEIIEGKGKVKASPDHTGDNPNLRRGPLESDDSRLDLLQWYLKMILEGEDERKD